MLQDRCMTDEHFLLLSKSYSDSLPFCRGVLPVTPDDLFLCYGNDENARCPRLTLSIINTTDIDI